MQRERRSRNSIVLTLLLLASVSALAAADAQRVVNVNTADAKQLSLLPRVGLGVAQRIVDYRKQNGPFKSTDELMLVRGVGEKLYAQLKPYVVTSGETTLDEKVASAGRGGKTKGSKAKGAKAKGAKGTAKAGTRAESAAAPAARSTGVGRANRSKGSVAAKPATGASR